MRLFIRTATGLVISTLLFACSPTTTYRYTAMVPSVRPLAWDGRTAKAGSLRLEGTFAASTIHENVFPQIGDTAVNVATREFSGLAALAVTQGVEIGVRGSYSAYGWTDPSAVGTEPLLNHPSLWGVGPEARATIPIDHEKHFAIGVGLSYLHYQVPYAEWQLSSCTPSPTCTVDPSTFDNAHYQLANQSSEAHWAINIGLHPSYSFGPNGQYGRIFGVFGAHTGFTNDGFTNTMQSGSTISSGLVWLAGAGYGIQVDEVHVSVLAFQPFNGSGSHVDYGPGIMLTGGVDFELWGKSDHVRPTAPLPVEYVVPPPPPSYVSPPGDAVPPLPAPG
jgi:hypothetical protein